MKNNYLLYTLGVSALLSGISNAAVSFTGETMEVLGTTYSSSFIDPANGNGNLVPTGTIAFDSAIDINDLFLEVGQNVRNVTVTFTFAAGGGSLTGFTESFFDLPNNGNISYTRNGAFSLGATGGTLGSAGASSTSQNGITLLNFTGSGAVESITIAGSGELETLAAFAGVEAVPEPSSTLLLGLGGLSLLARRKRG